MKKSLVYLLSVVLLGAFAISCKEKVKPLSERIAKVWQPRLVLEDGTTVFQDGSQNNIQPGYSTYRLDLSSSPTVRLTEFEGTVFTGTYSIEGDSKLILTGLSPIPTDTDGTITFTINSSSETELELTSDQPFAKTGNTLNKYTLISN